MLQGKQLLAYTAGIIDGEGCISIYRCRERRVTRGYYCRLVIRLFNTSHWLINWLKMQYGGYVTRKKQPSNRWKEQWAWQLYGGDAASFLQLVLPYLAAKRPQAEIAIEFQKRRTRSATTDEEYAADEAQYAVMRGLNQRSPNRHRQNVEHQIPTGLSAKQRLAYTAGIIDGEGTITIFKNKEKRNRRGHSYRLLVVAETTDLWVGDWLRKQYDGSLYLTPLRRKHTQRSCRWQLWSHRASLFLQQILPYLTIKRPNAEIAIAFQSRRKRASPTDAEDAADEAQYLAMRELNRKGPPSLGG